MATPPKPSAGQDAHDPTSSDDWVTIGEILGAFGVAGELKVRPLTDFPERFATTPTVYLGEDHVPYTVLGARIHQQHVLLRLAGCDSPTACKRVMGLNVLLPASQLCPLPEGRFYIHDIVGLRVVTKAGEELGTVTDVIASGGHDLYVVRSATTGRETYLPAVAAFIAAVDLAAGMITVTPIPGLFDSTDAVADDTTEADDSSA